MDREFLKKQLVRHEGLRLKPYKDTVGKLTIGVGRNLDDVGISEEEAGQLLSNDIDKVDKQLSQLDWYNKLDPVRQTVIANMTFNMGIGWIDKFANTVGLIKQGKYDMAADLLMKSLWAKQVGKRAEELTNILRTGKV